MNDARPNPHGTCCGSMVCCDGGTIPDVLTATLITDPTCSLLEGLTVSLEVDIQGGVPEEHVWSGSLPLAGTGEISLHVVCTGNAPGCCPFVLQVVVTGRDNCPLNATRVTPDSGNCGPGSALLLIYEDIFAPLQCCEVISPDPIALTVTITA